ncbi:hypothetical protein C8J57DRAFT_1563295 [Mycena rebaudengoi]|nr:hypothetical protein C8J57DRAFT_1563295 [Mycena rebaudengoi]
MPPPETLPLVTQEILAQCPKFRVLVVGRSGVGKSSLITHAFGIAINSVSHQERGKCDINVEITSTQNPLFVLHDSMGFEPGQIENFVTAKNFLESRSGEGVALKDRVHAIWLCIQVPVAGKRVFETGDEEFLKLASATEVPIVVVFTQFDKLVNRMEQELTDEEEDMPEERITQLCLQRAVAEFKKACVGPLERIDSRSKLTYARSSGLAGSQFSKPDREALAHLVQITRDLVQTHVEGEVWIVSAMAQRASARVKLNASIEHIFVLSFTPAVCLNLIPGYWTGLASNVKFLNKSLEQCLRTVHEDITDSWNFYDPKELLNGSEFLKKIKILAQLVTPDPEEAKSSFENLEEIQALVGLGTIVAAAAVGPAIAAIGLSLWFVKWIANAYNKTPETLRCFMGYIIDLTLVMEQLFLVVLSIRPPRALSEADIDLALENYKNSEIAQVHREIRQYTNKTTWAEILQSNKAEKGERTH